VDRILDGCGIKVKTQIRYLLAVPPLLFLGVFYFYPLISIFGLSFAPQGAWETGKLYRLVGNGYYLRVLWFTTWQAGLSTLLTLIIALPAAYVFAHYEFRGKALIQSLITVPFILPTVVTAAAFRALLGPGGLVNTGLMAAFDLSRPPVNIDHTVWFFLLAHIFYNYTVIVRLVGGFWARLPRDVNEAARMLGASRRQVFLKVTLPLLMPAVLAASLLIFVFCFTHQLWCGAHFRGAPPGHRGGGNIPPGRALVQPADGRSVITGPDYIYFRLDVAVHLARKTQCRLSDSDHDSP